MNQTYKVVTVTLNPCIDRLVSIQSFTRGGMNRAAFAKSYAAGKGINVGCALKNLGTESLCAGFNYSDNGALIENFLNEAGIAHDFITAEGAVRTNIKLTEQDTHVMTEINEAGAFVPPELVDALIKKIAALDGDILILSGSRPRGVGEDIYARLISSWKGRAFLDTEGAALTAAVFSSKPPYLIKPNLFELETAFGVKLPDRESIMRFCRKELCGRGIALVCVSLGGDGALLVTSAGAWFAPVLDIPVRGLAGAGDSMVAGFAAGVINGKPPEELLRMAAAAAAASVIREGTQMCTREDYEKMLEKILVYPV